MKKGKIFTGMLALFVVTIAIAFKTSHTLPVVLYYYNNDSACIEASFETTNHANKACLIIVYTDSNCTTEYKGDIWAKNSY